MKESNRYHHKARRGGILISALAFVTVTSMLMIGMLTFSVSFYARAKTESDYESALSLAEAGANYEFRKISSNAANADQKSGGTGVTYSLGNGTFNVYCSNKDGSTPWVAPANMVITTIGTINGVSRTLQITGKAYSAPVIGDYALYGVTSGTISGSAATVQGDIGTNASLNFNGSPTVTGSLNFNGGSPTIFSGYTIHQYPNPIVWPTVDSIANAAFSGGLNYIATHSDNPMASPPIISNSITLHGNGSVTFYGKAGGANYYLTSMSCNGNSGVTFDNTNGPITIWVGPTGGAGVLDIGGGAAAIKQTTDVSKPVQIYVATAGGARMHGNSELDCGIYSYNGAGSGPVTLSGTPDIYGSIITDQFGLNGNPTVHYRNGYFVGLPSAGVSYYGFDDQWLEINGL